MASWTEDFNRADNVSLGANWTEDQGNIDIVSNKADATTAAVHNRARYTGTPFDTSNHYMEAVGGVHGGTDRLGVAFRQAGSANTCYQWAWVSTNVGGVKLRSLSAGTETEIGSATQTGTADHTFKGQADGTTISGWIDGVSAVSVTNTAIATGLYGGLLIYGANGLWDSAAGADLSTGNAASSIGAGTATANGISRADVPFSSTGSGTAIGVGSALITSAANATGTATATFVGSASALGSGAASSVGTGTAAAVSSSANTGVVNASGTSTAIVTGSASARSVVNSQGTSTATKVGASSATGVVNAQGTATAIAVGAVISAGSGAVSSAGIATATATSRSTAAAVLSVAGASTARFVGSNGETERKKFGPRGRKIAEKQKRKQLELELQNIVTQDEEDLAVIRAALMEYLKMAA